MKEIKIKKIERKKTEKSIFNFVFLAVIMIFTFINCSAQQRIITEVKYDKIVVNSVEDIYQKRDGLFVFSDVNIDLRKVPYEKRKEVFVKLLLPSIEVVQQEVLNNREIVRKMKAKKHLTESEKIYAEKLFKKYRTEYGKWNELESKMIVYPASLILTQGAIESAWGTSRFFREANNAFGVWSTNPSEPRIAAKGSRGDFTPHLKKYATLKDTVEDITLIISRSSAYTGARKMIWDGKSPYEIAGGLTKYSEEGKEYVRKVRSTLKYNNFHEYDTMI